LFAAEDLKVLQILGWEAVMIKVFCFWKLVFPNADNRLFLLISQPLQSKKKKM